MSLVVMMSSMSELSAFYSRKTGLQLWFDKDAFHSKRNFRLSPCRWLDNSSHSNYWISRAKIRLKIHFLCFCKYLWEQPLVSCVLVYVPCQWVLDFLDSCSFEWPALVESTKKSGSRRRGRRYRQCHRCTPCWSPSLPWGHLHYAIASRRKIFVMRKNSLCWCCNNHCVQFASSHACPIGRRRCCSLKTSRRKSFGRKSFELRSSWGSMPSWRWWVQNYITWHGSSKSFYCQVNHNFV